MALSDYQRRVLDDGATAYWPLDDPSGTVARDLVGTPTEIPCDLEKAYLQARSGIARSCASRSNYVFPLLGVITVDGLDLTDHILYGSLRVTLELNEQPDTCSFDVMLTDAAVQAAIVVGADVVIGLGGPSENAIFGGRILTAQTTRGPARGPSKRSVMCADYLQVLDSEYLVTYDWPPQSATITILDLVARFANKTGGVAISTAGVQATLPNHAAFAVANERFSTVLRRLVTMFPSGGGFYIDPLKVLHVWQGAAEPGLTPPSPLTIENPLLKSFSETVDNAQQRDAVIVEGRRTTAPIGTPGPWWDDPTGRIIYTVPVIDASIFDAITTTGGADREVRIGTQRFQFQKAFGPWTAPPGTAMTTTVTADVAFAPGTPEGNASNVFVESVAFLAGREQLAWVLIDEQYLLVYDSHTTPSPYLEVQTVGYGGMIGPIKAGAVVTAVDSVTIGTVTGRYDALWSLEQVRAQPIDADVVMTVRSATGDAVHEQLVQDGRFSRAGATGRGQREIADFAQPLISVQFETEDLNAKPGRLQAYDFDDPPLAPMAGEYMILSAELSWPVWGDPPRRVCQAAAVQSANVVDTWLVDPR